MVFGCESTDARTGLVPAMVAERLGVPQLTLAGKVDVAGSEVTIRRVTDDGVATVTGSLPAVVSVNEKINEPRYPTFKGIMAAKKKPVQTLTLGDISVDAGQVGLDNAASWVEDFAKRPPRQAGMVVKDEGDGGARSPGSSPSTSSSREDWDMAEVLVLAERDADGEVKKVTLELLTAARRLGRAVRRLARVRAPTRRSRGWPSTAPRRSTRPTRATWTAT